MTFRKLPALPALAAFEAIARHRSFSMAAKELYLTPSAISQRLRQLEKHLDTQLVMRTRRSVRLTAVGAQYLEAVHAALSRLVDATESISRAGARRVRLGIVPALAANWLLYRLPEFHRRFPQIDLDIHAAIAMADVKGGEVDVAIRWGKGDWPGLEMIELFADELLPVCSRTYLRKAGPMRSPADLRKAVLLRNTIQPWKPWLQAAGLDWPEPTQGPSFNDSTLALQAAVDGHGVALGRRMLVRDLLADGALVKLFAVSAAIDEAFYLVYSKDALRRPEVSAFVDWIRSAAQAESRPAVPQRAAKA